MWFLLYLLLRGRRPQPKPHGLGEWVRAYLLAAAIVGTLILIGLYA